ncbi:MAG TPA: VCBS repeat-containing protein, partial [Kofleriaceae bacterium]|nr:VCBS repeat-containing protein [Kofleriaceae bacterium]
CRKCAGGRTCETANDCFNGMCVATTKTCFGLPVVSFGPAVSYPSGEKTYVLFSADINGDGFIDLVAGNEQESTLSVFLNNGAGAFQRVTPSFRTGDYPTGGTIADFNRDGIPDVVTADYHGDSVSILLGINGGMGKGTGALAAKSTYPTVDGAETSNLAIGDLNGDGNLDVIATNPQAHSVSEFLGRGDGTLAPAIDVPVGTAGSSEPYSVAIGDFDRDGKSDVAIANVRSGTIVVRLGNGDGTFQDEVTYPEGGTPPYILITHDVNVDGKLDLVCANRASSDVSVLLGRGDGTFRKAIVSRTGPKTGPYSVAVADFNLDGVPDVATANFESSTASVLLGIGNGGFEAPIDAGATGEISYGVIAADLNGDGKPDLGVASARSNDVTVKLSTSH